MRIRDWSSDVCSSDLELDDEDGLPALDDPARPLDDRDLVTLDVDLHDGRPQPIPAEGVVEGDQRDEIIGHRAGVLAGDPVRLRTEAGARGHIDSRDHAQPGDPGGAGMQWPQQVEIVDGRELFDQRDQLALDLDGEDGGTGGGAEGADVAEMGPADDEAVAPPKPRE